MNDLNFKFVKYKNFEYPEGLDTYLKEVAGHLDKTIVNEQGDYSLHTEYSYTTRKLSNEVIDKYSNLKNDNKKGVPQLWKSIEWANEFGNFVLEITKESVPPKVIEIHPPFNDYCNMDEFLKRYDVFEKIIHKEYPDAQIVIENRSGSRYSGGKFILSKSNDIIELCNKIKDNNIDLNVVLDFPQLLTAEHIETTKFDKVKYENIIDSLLPHSELIVGVHVWGKKRNARGWTSHVGTLDTYFDDNKDLKECFVKGIFKLCNDGKERYFVPEVNSREEDMHSILKDILKFK